MAIYNNKQEDIELIRKVKNGDEKAFEAIVKKYKKSLHFTVFNIVRDEKVAEDITLDSFMRVFTNIQNYNETYSFSTWLFTIATNLAIDYTRSKKHIRFKTSDEDAHNAGIYLDTLENKQIETPEATLINKNQRKLLEKLLKQIKPEQRKIIELRYFEELSYKEIADVLDISVSMVKTKLHRAKKQLQKVFKNFENQI